MTPLIKTLSLGAGGAVAAVAIYFSSIIGVNYTSAILNHLTDIVNGQTTNTVVANNAPNWGQGIPLATPTASSIATTTGSLASSTPYTFAVAATDAFGTTTLSATQEQATDASTTGQKAEGITIQWSPVQGATGYAIYFGTSSSATGSQLGQCFNATTTSQFTFSTSTGSYPCSNTFSDTHAFSDLISPYGVSYLNGGNGTATTSVASSSALEVNGNLRVTSNGTTTNCFAATAGAVFFNTANGHEWGCSGTSWTKIF